MGELGDDELMKILRAFDDPGIPPADNWSRLASYHTAHGNPEEARWCQLRAGGMSSADACRIAYPDAPQMIDSMDLSKTATQSPSRGR